MWTFFVYLKIFPRIQNGRLRFHRKIERLANGPCILGQVSSRPCNCDFTEFAPIHWICCNSTSRCYFINLVDKHSMWFAHDLFFFFFFLNPKKIYIFEFDSLDANAPSNIMKTLSCSTTLKYIYASTLFWTCAKV